MDRALLRGVSRTFYVTIRLLPRPVRGPVALGYLLARASDSIADTSTAPIARRVEVLRSLRELDFGERALAELVSHQKKPAEAALLRSLPRLLSSLEASPDRDALVAVWDKILEGQIFDLVRFSTAPSRSLSAEELDEYVYLVAGSVGEFWTSICEKYLPSFSTKSHEAMSVLGCRYGKGLQLVNILRDRNEDAARGRVYVTADDFESMRDEASRCIEDGLRWVDAVCSGRIRYACLPPAVIALRMLKRMQTGEEGVKLTRGQVRSILAQCIPVLWSRSAMRAATRG